MSTVAILQAIASRVSTTTWIYHILKLACNFVESKYWHFAKGVNKRATMAKVVSDYDDVDALLPKSHVDVFPYNHHSFFK